MHQPRSPGLELAVSCYISLSVISRKLPLVPHEMSKLTRASSAASCGRDAPDRSSPHRTRSAAASRHRFNIRRSRLSLIPWDLFSRHQLPRYYCKGHPSSLPVAQQRLTPRLGSLLVLSWSCPCMDPVLHFYLWCTCILNLQMWTDIMLHVNGSAAGIVHSLFNPIITILRYKDL